MNTQNQLLVVLLAAVFLGCSTEPIKGGKVGATKSAVSTSPALPDITHISTRLTPTPSTADCPRNETSWKKESIKNLSQLANSCARLGKFERLNQIGEFIAQKDPMSPWGSYYMSVSSELEKEYARALWMIDLAITKSPTTAILHYQKGRVHWALNEFSKSVVSYKQAIQYYPRFADAHLFLAQLALRDQDFNSAIKHFSIVAGIEPDNAASYAGWAEAKIASGDARTAVELYEKAVLASPRNIGYRIKLSGLYETAQNDLELALLSYKKLKTLMTESRKPAEALNIDVSGKIQKLELALAKVAADSAKMTQAEPNEKPKKKVNK